MRCHVLPMRFHREAARIIDAPWAIAVGADFLHPQTLGPKPQAADLANRYTQRLVRADPHLAATRADVQPRGQPGRAALGAGPPLGGREVGAASVTGLWRRPSPVHPRVGAARHLNRTRACARVSLRDRRRGSGQLAVAPAPRAGGRGCPLDSTCADGGRAAGRRGPDGRARPGLRKRLDGSVARPPARGPAALGPPRPRPRPARRRRGRPAPGGYRRRPRHRRDPAGRPHPAGPGRPRGRVTPHGFGPARHADRRGAAAVRSVLRRGRLPHAADPVGHRRRPAHPDGPPGCRARRRVRRPPATHDRGSHPPRARRGAGGRRRLRRPRGPGRGASEPVAVGRRRRVAGLGVARRLGRGRRRAAARARHRRRRLPRTTPHRPRARPARRHGAAPRPARPAVRGPA